MAKYDTFFPGETVILEQEGWLVKSLFNAKTGTVVLTDKRIAFIEKKVIVGGGLLVKAADAALGVSKPNLKADVEFSELKSHSWPKKMDLLIENNSGETFKLRGPDQQKWEEQIQKLIKN